MTDPEERLECKICYCDYNTGSRRPKRLDCGHRVCSKCLDKILHLVNDNNRAPLGSAVCPFCRHVTRSASTLPDDRIPVSPLVLWDDELLLSPSRLVPSTSCLLITIVEPPPSTYRSPGTESAVSAQTLIRLCQAVTRTLLWLLGLVYLSSLPLGMYLLIMQKTAVGFLLVSLVPSSLLLGMGYSLCRHLCRQCGFPLVHSQPSITLTSI